MKRKSKHEIKNWIVSITLATFLFALFINYWKFISDHSGIILIITGALLIFFISQHYITFKKIKKTTYRKFK